MTTIKKFFEAYFVHSVKSRFAVLCILLLIALTYLYPYVFVARDESSPINSNPTILAAIDTLQARKQDEEQGDNDDFRTVSYSVNNKIDFEKGELFSFDPNTLSAEDWRRLGVKDKTIKTITNYRNKSGKFYQPEDLQKIWGLPQGF